MNATELFNAVNSAKKPAAIGFLTILGLATVIALATAISNLLALLIPLLMLVTKAAIYAYPLFIAGLIGSSPASRGNFRLKPLPDGSFPHSGNSVT